MSFFINRREEICEELLSYGGIWGSGRKVSGGTSVRPRKKTMKKHERVKNLSGGLFWKLKPSSLYFLEVNKAKVRSRFCQRVGWVSGRII